MVSLGSSCQDSERPEWWRKDAGIEATPGAGELEPQARTSPARHRIGVWVAGRWTAWNTALLPACDKDSLPCWRMASQDTFSNVLRKAGTMKTQRSRQKRRLNPQPTLNPSRSRQTCQPCVEVFEERCLLTGPPPIPPLLLPA